MGKFKVNAVSRLVIDMSFERKFSRQKIQELGIETYQHVFKILMFPDSSFVTGWEKEIRAWYKSCVKYTNIKGGTFKPKDLEKLLLEGLFFPRKNIAADIQFAIDQNDELEPRRLFEFVAESRVLKFYSMMSESLYANDDADALDLAFNILKG